jgi:hypothetical protein
MVWTPTTTVTIEGVDFTGDTVGTVRIVRGRTNVYEEVPPGYAVVELVDVTGTGFDVDPATILEIAIADSTSTPVLKFTGRVTDIDRTLYSSGLVGDPASITRLTAVGPLAKAARRQAYPGGRPAEQDADRVAAFLIGGLGQTWEEYQGSTWADAVGTWATVDPGIDPALIDAGIYDLAVLDPQDGGYQALTGAAEASFSGAGIIYETGTGYVGWYNAQSRGLSPTYTIIPGDWITASSVATSTSLSDLANRVDVVYSAGSVVATDPTSVSTYGVYERRLTTQLANIGNAQTRAVEFVERHAYPLVNLDRVTVRIDGLDDADADALLAIDVNTPVYLTGLPDTLRVTDLPGFVEGIQLDVDAYRANLTLMVSDAQLSIGSMRWEQVPATLIYQDVSGSLQWQNARSL